MRKDQIVSEDILDNIKLERDILSDGQCEFLLSLSFFYQSPERIYFVTPFIPGGDLYTLLKKKGHLEEDLVRFYTGQIALAIGHLHEHGIAYRDLKPENILIDEDGYLKLCDFGSCIHMQGTKKEFTFAGSVEYASPEMISGVGHNIMTDWWSFGILLFELLYGCLPFYSLNKKRLFELIMMSEIKFPKFYVNENGENENYKVSNEAKNLILKLLVKEPGDRIGKKGLEEIKSDSFFGTLKFDDLKNKSLQSPYKPNVGEEEKFNNFDQEFLNMDVNESKIDEWVNDYKDWFNDFDKNNEEEQEDNDY
jgi:serine/threonine protein kinase